MAASSSTGESKDVDSSGTRGESSSAWEDSAGETQSSNNDKSSSELESGQQDPSSEAGSQRSESSAAKCKKRKKSKKSKKSSEAATSTEDDSAPTTTEGSTNDSTSNADKSSTSRQSNVANDGWTISDDGLLRGMKEGGATWADISKSVHKHKKECQARWKMIKDQAAKSQGSETAEVGTTEAGTTEPETNEQEITEAETNEVVTTEPGTTEAEATSGTDQVENQTSSTQNDSEEVSSEVDSADDCSSAKDGKSKEKCQKGKGKDAAKTGNKTQKKKKQTKDDNGEPCEQEVSNKWHKGKRNAKVAAENKKAKAHATKAQDENLSGEEASFETSSSATPSEESSSNLTDFGFGEEEWRREMRYLQDGVYESMYPPDIHPAPDAYFSARDCRLLGLIDSKQKRSKWLEMQANFYNVTGRMVPLELIRDKCERAEAAKRGEQCDESLADDQSHVQKWVDGISQDDLEDPET